MTAATGARKKTTTRIAQWCGVPHVSSRRTGCLGSSPWAVSVSSGMTSVTCATAKAMVCKTSCRSLPRLSAAEIAEAVMKETMSVIEVRVRVSETSHSTMDTPSASDQMRRSSPWGMR